MNNSDTGLLLKFAKEDNYSFKGDGRYIRSEDHSSFIIDTQDSLFYWNSRNLRGGPLDYLIKVRGLPYKVAKSVIDRTFSPKLLSVQGNNKEDVLPYIPLVKKFWELGKNNRQYWYDRLLTDSTIDLYQLGYYDGWYTVPIFCDGELVNFQKRRDTPSKSVHMWYNNGYHLFNSSLAELFDPIYLVEGLVDAILLNQIGIPAISKTIGAGVWKQEWAKYFIRVNRVYVVYDNDVAGRRGSSKVANILGKYKCKIFNFDGYKDKYDIGDYFKDGNTRGDFISLIEEKSKYVFEV